MKGKKIGVFVLALLAFAAELLPYGVVINMAVETAGGAFAFRRAGYSYFDMSILIFGGYVQFAAGVLTAAALIVAGVFCLTGRLRLAAAFGWLSLAAAVLSAVPLFYLNGSYNAVSALVSVLLATGAALGLMHSKRIPKNPENTDSQGV